MPLLFTRDKCIIAGASDTLLITAIYESIDGFQLLAGGVLNGCGRQGIVSLTNFFIYQCFAAPLAIYLCVVLKLYTKGYRIGMATGVFLQAIIYISLVLCTNWRQVADSAQRNIAFPENNARYNSNQSGTESSSLTASSFGPSKIKYYKWCQNIAKLLTVAIFVSSFVIGLGFSFKQLSLLH